MIILMFFFLQRIALEAKVNKMDMHAQQLWQELDKKNEAIKIMQHEVCVKSVDAKWLKLCLITVPL
jgi:hypothetical protein